MEQIFKPLCGQQYNSIHITSKNELEKYLIHVLKIQLFLLICQQFTFQFLFIY
jgi:hypothetical protein